MMTTLTVNIDNKKTEKAVKAVLDALGLDYNTEQHPDKALTPSEKAMYNRLKKSAEQIKLYKEGKVTLRPIEDVLADIS